MSASATRDATKFVAIDILADFIFFPVWWYTAGFVRALLMAGSWFRDTLRMFGLGIWIKNIFVPMFAQYDIWGRVISFIVRLANIIGRALALLIVALIILALLLVYLALPLLLAWLIVTKLFAVMSA